MAGKYITVPGNKTYSGKPEQRYQMPDGEIRLTNPNWEGENGAPGMGLQDLWALRALNDPRYYGQAKTQKPAEKKGPTSFADALVGTPFVLNGVLGFKNQDGKFQARGDMEGPVDGLTIDESSLPSREDPSLHPRQQPQLVHFDGSQAVDF